MNRQNKSVIMSAKDTSQRSSFSCSSSWWPPRLCRLCADIRLRLRGRRLGVAAARLRVVARAQGRRDEGDELLLDDARVVAGLDREDALDDQRPGVQLGFAELFDACR